MSNTQKGKLAELNNILIAEGSNYSDDTSTKTPDPGKYFYCIIPNEDTVVNTMTVETGWADLSGKTLPQGIPKYTNCSSIKLTSGSVDLYQRSSS